MNIPTGILPELDVGTEDFQRVRELARGLSGTEALWLSGYFAGVADAREAFSGEVVARTQSASVEDVPTSTSPKVRILYGSETGNAVAIANTAVTQMSENGISAEVSDLATYKHRDLISEQLVLVVVSTHGEGEPPETAIPFFEFLSGPKAPKLSAVRYAVIALGDSTYEFFCEAGKRLDAKLLELGATRILDRCDCDVDYEVEVAPWMDRFIAELGGASSYSPVQTLVAEGEFSSCYDKNHPYRATVIENQKITGRGSSKETRHIELDISGSGLSYVPGDALGVIAQNDPVLVEEIISSLEWSGSEEVVHKEQTVDVRSFLLDHVEINALTPSFLKRWAEVTERKDLLPLLDEGARKDLTEFLGENQIIDLILAGGPKGITPNDLGGAFRPLQPRLYSIASSAIFVPDEVHLCVARVRYDLKGRERHGVASEDLSSRRKVGSEIPVYVQENGHFRLPETPETPIIMIGAGTGIAPYRAFLQEREAEEAAGPSWLMFGERNFRTDFLYQTEIQSWTKSRLLSRVDLAFSRDQEEKTYVQHKIREKSSDIISWIDDGAHVYVCGDMKMAKDVHETLLQSMVANNGGGIEEAREVLRKLQADGRYQRDVY